MDARALVDGFVRDADFLARYPYYAAVLARVSPVLDPSVETLALSLHDGRFFLHVNAAYFAEHPEHARGILLHEVHHLVLGHLTHPRFFAAREPELMQLAMEMSANEHITEALPDPITFTAFERLGITKGQSTVERYELLLAAKEAGKTVSSSRAGKRVDDHPWKPDKNEAPPPGGLEHTRAVIAGAIADVGDAPGLVKTKLAGKAPGTLLESLTGETQDPAAPIDWRTALRMFVARERAPIHTYARPNRRFPSRVGEVPGRAYAPRSVPRPTLLVAIDTSMSMTRAELDEIARQLRPMSEVARLVIVECDAAVQRTYPFDGTLRVLAGRGGTDLRPVFEPSLRKAHRADGIVFFTDGQGPHPKEAPDVPVLFILTKPDAFACPWGARALFPRSPSRGRRGAAPR